MTNSPSPSFRKPAKAPLSSPASVTRLMLTVLLPWALLPGLACSSGEATGGSGGSSAGGGNPGSGGASQTGGAIGSGGTGQPGGAPGSGGIPASGGAPGSGGGVPAGGTGGLPAAGGAGGPGASGGRGTSTGGAAGGRGGNSSGGNAGSGTAGAGAGGATGSGGAGGASCMTPPPPGPLVGWAAVPGLGQTGTTGGGTATPIVVTTLAGFVAAAAGPTPRVIHVMGSLTGTFSIGSNKTVIGLCGARLRGHVSLSNSVNVIVRNLTIVGYNCTDSPGDCSGGDDAVTVGNNSHHVWFDHDDVYDGSDGNLDITSGADFVTVSWTKFHYSTRRTDPEAGASGHRFSNLIGSADDVPGDVGRLNVTFHHNWWAENIDQRMPRTRNGKIHVFNNLFTAVGNSYCTNAGFQASLLVESNIYRGVRNPLQPDANGNMRELNNIFDGTTGTRAATGTGFTPTYSYTADPTSNLAATIMSQAGPR